MPASGRQSGVDTPLTKEPVSDPESTNSVTGTSYRCRMCESTQVAPIGQARGYEFVECSECRLIFIPSLNASHLEAEYCAGRTTRHKETPVHGWAVDLRFLEPAFERLSKNRPLHILDFGCGNSCTPDLLRLQGHRVIGVDLGSPLRPHPDRITGNLLYLGLAPQQFDLVYAYQVFEHLPEPRAVLEELVRLVKPQGLLLIHTDMETPQRQQGFFDWFYLLPPDHCSYYQIRTFEKALERQPASIVWSNPWSVLIEKRPLG